MPRSETVGIDDDWRLDGNVAITSSQLASMSLTVVVVPRCEVVSHPRKQVTGQLAPAVMPSATPRRPATPSQAF
jgi:hypothetical protein